jgi:hypothetical protein
MKDQNFFLNVRFIGSNFYGKNLERKGDEVIGTPLLPTAMQQKDRPVL